VIPELEVDCERVAILDGGRIVLFQGDSKDILEQMDILNGLRVDMVLCDPPYGIKYQGANAFSAIAYDEQPHTEFVLPMARLMKDNTAMYLCSREDVSHAWRLKMHEAGLNVKSSILWHKMGGGQGDSQSDLQRPVELILIGHRGRSLLRPWSWHHLFHWIEKAKATHKGGRRPIDIPDPSKEVRRDTVWWEFPVPQDRVTRAQHPTPKPPEIMERALISHTDPQGIVLDPFMGSGPVGVACVRQHRQYIGIEIESGYFDTAVANIQAAIKERDDDVSL